MRAAHLLPLLTEVAFGRELALGLCWSRFSPLIARQTEIHLLLEAVHFGDLHLHFVAEPDHAAIPAANQLGAVGAALAAHRRCGFAVSDPRRGRRIQKNMKKFSHSLFSGVLMKQLQTRSFPSAGHPLKNWDAPARQIFVFTTCV